MIVGSAIIMQQIDLTVITTALPQMAISLHADPVQLSLAATAYLLSLAIFVPISGWAADRFGGRGDLSRRHRAVHAGLDPLRAVRQSWSS